MERMPEEKLIDQIRAVVREEVKAVRDEVKEEIKATEKRIVETVTKKIDESQADTIQVLSALIHTGHADHEARINQIEKVLHISKN